MRYTDDSRERVRDAVDFAELVGARTELRTGGQRRLIGLCPFHDERTPSFGIDPIEKLYHCFGCGKGGDVFQFVIETEALDFTGALELLADRYGVRLEQVSEDPEQAAKRTRRERLVSLMERTAEFYVRMFWESKEAEGAREYLQKRGFTEETLRAFRVGFAPSAWDKVLMASQRSGFSTDELQGAGLVVQGREGGVYDRFRARVIFPLCDTRGTVIGFGARALRDNQQPKYLNSPDSELFRKGRWVYAAHHARVEAAKSGRVIVAEGYTDVMAFHQAGIHSAVGMMGTALTDHQASELARLAPLTVLCLDADSAGRAAVGRAAELLASRSRELRVVPLPTGSDPADLIMEAGGEEMLKRLDNSVPFAHFEVEQIIQSNDLENTAGRDKALTEIGPIVRKLPPSLLREELVQLTASRLGLSESLTTATLSAPAQRPAAPSPFNPGPGRFMRGSGQQYQRGKGAKGPVGDFDPSPVVSSGHAMGRGEQTERAFLALCVALPDLGKKQLGEADIDDLFFSSAARKTAHYLKTNLEAPGKGLPEGDQELSKTVAELVVRAGQIEATPRALELEKLQLKLARLERELTKAKAAGGDLTSLVRRREEIQVEVRRLLQ